MLKINDIKPIVEIPDWSIYLYYGIAFVILLILFFIFYIGYKFFKPKVTSQEMIWLEILKNIDLKDTKKAAYSISKYGRYLAKEERQIRLIEELTNELSFYKYKKETDDSFTDSIITKLSIFMDTLDVK